MKSERLPKRPPRRNAGMTPALPVDDAADVAQRRRSVALPLGPLGLAAGALERGAHDGRNFRRGELVDGEKALVEPGEAALDAPLLEAAGRYDLRNHIEEPRNVTMVVELCERLLVLGLDLQRDDHDCLLVHGRSPGLCRRSGEDAGLPQPGQLVPIGPLLGDAALGDAQDADARDHCRLATWLDRAE